MSVSPMKLVTIAGPLEEFDRTVRRCIVNREFHPEPAMNVMRQVKGLFPFELQNPYTELLRLAQKVSDVTGIALDYRDFPPDACSAEEAESLFGRLESRFSALTGERGALVSRAEEDRQILIQLEHVRDVNIPLQDFFNCHYVRFRFGRMPREVYESFLPHIFGRDDIYFFVTETERDYIYGMYMTPRESAENVDSLFASMQFERLYISGRVEGTGTQAIDAMKADIQAAQERAREIDAELERMRRDEAEEFLKCYSFVRYMNDSYETRRFAAHTGESFYLLGWVPAAEFDGFSKNIEQYSGLNFVVVSEDPDSLTDFTPPVKLKNSRLFRAFEPFVGMYGLPAYNETDPTPLMAITYSLLFGVMFGDLGQGAVVALAGYLMWRLKHMWLGRVLVYAGVCSMLFGGLVYGSIFGYEDLGFGFKVLHPAANSQTILTVSVYGGAGLITVAVIINMINGIRQRNMEKALFGSAGLAGGILYWGIVLLVLPFVGFGEQVVSPAVLILCAALPLLLVFLREPLSYIAEKRKKWTSHGGKADFIMSGFFELFETLLSYMTNTLSFLRVGAYAISHASMMAVVYSMATAADGSRNIFVIVIGNILVTGIEALLVGIQVLRLDFYELFGRFYSGTGRPYQPIKIDYKTRDTQ
ncbi:MAG: ATPase V [Oscillospiraceae bacterium]|nr:ATPase V [Oscillospiraceae bacterium]